MRQTANAWQRLNNSIWFLPALCAAAAVLLAFVSIAVDRRVGVEQANGLWFVFAAGAEGARGVLGTIAGSLITVTGVVFSITIVVLQLASTQFTPRVIRAFTEDRANHWVLGAFIGTFIYALLIMRSVRAPGEDYGGFVPAISVTIALLLALVSVGLLIFFMHHIARSIRVEVIMDRVARDAMEVVDVLFPEQIGDAAEPPAETAWQPPPGAATVLAWAGGYVQAFDDNPLREAARDTPLTVVLYPAIGDFVVEGDVVARVWPMADEQATTMLQRALTLGPERTRHQDVGRGIIELADIGIRALSPSLNDPSTTVACVDRMTEIVTRLGTRRFPDDARVELDGRLRILVVTPTFDEIVRLAYRELRHHGSADPVVSLRIVSSLARVAARVPAHRREPLLDEMKHLAAQAEDRLFSDYDVRRVQQAVAAALASLGQLAE